MTTATLFIKTLISCVSVLVLGEIMFFTTGGHVERPTFWQMMTLAIAMCVWVEMVTGKEPKE